MRHHCHSFILAYPRSLFPVTILRKCVALANHSVCLLTELRRRRRRRRCHCCLAKTHIHISPRLVFYCHSANIFSPHILIVLFASTSTSSPSRYQIQRIAPVAPQERTPLVVFVFVFVVVFTSRCRLLTSGVGARIFLI